MHKGFIAAAMLVLSGQAFALSSDVVIDEFTVFQQTGDLGPTGTTYFGEVGSGAETSILGGYRDLYQEVTANTNPGISSSHSNAAGGLLAISNDFASKSIVQLTWDGNDNAPAVATTGLGGIDLTNGGNNNGILLKVLAIDLNVMAKFEVWTDALNSSIYTHSFAAASDFFFDFASFAGTADFANVGAVQLTLSGPTAWDGAIDLVVSSQVSEPGPLVLLGLGLGLIGIVAGRRRRSKV